MSPKLYVYHRTVYYDHPSPSEAPDRYLDTWITFDFCWRQCIHVGHAPGNNLHLRVYVTSCVFTWAVSVVTEKAPIISVNKATVTTRRTCFLSVRFLGGYVCFLGKEWRRCTSLARHSHGFTRCKSVVCTPRLAVACTDSVRRRYSPRTDALRLPTFLDVDSTQKHARRVVTVA
ncbi:hypothetical protein Bbelb_270810 [Branchiostoma belcheri]|nr:hypothetical protein Bbelb_270810 [Branchiostoma belcheri]